MAPFITLFKDFLIHLENKFEDFKEDLLTASKAKDEKIVGLEAQVSSMKKVIGDLERKMDNEDQYIRRESLIFSGDSIPEVSSDEEDPTDVVIQIVKDKIGVDILPNDISVAHRLGPKPTSLPDKRKLVAKFVRRNLKYTVLSSARRTKPQNFYVNESLTPTRQLIIRAIGKAKHDHPDIVAGYTTNNGTIHVFVKPPNSEDPQARNSRVSITTMDGLETFCQRAFQRPAVFYIPKPRTNASGRADGNGEHV